jgi:hypothetical protein
MCVASIIWYKRVVYAGRVLRSDLGRLTRRSLLIYAELEQAFTENTVGGQSCRRPIWAGGG